MTDHATPEFAPLSRAVANRYRIMREIGAGAMATVYLAHDLKHGRDVAIKVLKPELTKSLSGSRFLREIAVTARLNHPHILPLLDSGAEADGEILYYVMPVATGQSLRGRIATSGALPVVDALRIACDVTEALVHAHAHDVVHRDIKPDNILLAEGHAIVVDFGIAKAMGIGVDIITLTTSGMSLGTPAYMAPEQADNDTVVDHRADVYAVGAVLYEMLSGAPPFTGTFQHILLTKMAKDAPPLPARAVSLPPPLVHLLARCLSRDPAERPATAALLLGELRALSHNDTKQLSQHHHATLIGAGVALVIITVIAVYFLR